MVTTTFGAQQLAALVALLNITIIFRCVIDLFVIFCGRGILSETFDFLDCANYSGFFSKSFLSLQIAATFRRGTRSLVSLLCEGVFPATLR